MKKRYIQKRTYAKFPLAEAIKTLDPEATKNLERINPKPLESWRLPVFKAINIKQDIEKATQKIINLINSPEIVIFIGIIERKANLKTATAIIDQHNKIIRS